MDERDYSQEIREIERLTTIESFNELKTTGLHLMKFGFWLMSISGLFFVFTLIFIKYQNLDLDLDDAVIMVFLLYFFIVFTFAGIILFITGTYVQMKNVVRSVKACQRTLLMNDLKRKRKDPLEHEPGM